MKDELKFSREVQRTPSEDGGIAGDLFVFTKKRPETLGAENPTRRRRDMPLIKIVI